MPSKWVKKKKRHLILGDSHAHSQYDNLRFRAAGNFIEDTRPDVIVNLGDFADLPSLCHHDKGKLNFEGRRYKDDVEVTIDAQEELFKPWRDDDSYRPRLVLTLGNHCNRINRTVQELPELAGHLSVRDLRYEEYGWQVYPFLVPVCIDNISYCHYYVSGLMSRPIGGENQAKTMCNKLHASAVAGHSHIFDHSERAIINGTKIFGLSAGCFVHPDYHEEWSVATRQLWWRGIVMLEEVDGEGYYDGIHAITMRKLLRDYL